MRKKWFNKRSTKAKENKDIFWRRYRWCKSQAAFKRYMRKRNKYNRLRKEKQRNLERITVDKANNNPKLIKINQEHIIHSTYLFISLTLFQTPRRDQAHTDSQFNDIHPPSSVLK